MASNNPGQDRHPSDDEEAQLLSSSDEDDEQFELGNRSDPTTPTPAEPRPRNRPSPTTPGFCSRFLTSLCCSNPSQPPTVTPFFPSIQSLPSKLLPKRPWQRTLLFVLFVLSRVITLALPLFFSEGPAADTSGGAAAIRDVNCVETLWRPTNECGLDGVDCRPFGNVSFAFRCPKGCADAKVVGTRYVGRVEVDSLRGLVVGGGGDTSGEGTRNGISPYRGDSFLCGAAIHAGVIEDTTGGCAVATLVGEYYHYFSSVQHGIESIAFDSYFPMSFTITDNTDPTLSCPASYPGSTISSLTSTIIFTTLVFLLVPSPALRFFTTFLSIFTHVALTPDSPSDPLPTLLSNYINRLPPTLFIATVLYHTCVLPSLPPANLAPPLSIETTLFYLLPLYLGALSHTTLDPFLPDPTRLSRPTIPTILTAVVVGLVMALLVIHQLHTLSLASKYSPSPSSRGSYRLAIYAFLAMLVLTILVTVLRIILPTALADLHVHLPIYLVVLSYLPCTAVQTRVSWVFQGLLVGLFVDGVARGGLGPVLEVGGSALETGGMIAGYGTVVNGVGLPVVVPPLVEGLGELVSGAGGEMTIRFKWKGLTSTKEEDPVAATSEGTMAEGTNAKGISVLINDVERYRGWFAEQPLEEQTFVWTRNLTNAVLADEYFRFGFVTDGGRALGGYTEAGTWFVNGSWSQGVGYW